MSTPIQLLLCGSAADVPTDERDERTNALAGLGELINSYFEFSIGFKKEIGSARASYFLPIALRSLMETATIALLARVDPLRVIHSSKSQDSADYIKSRQQASALKWKNDIIGEENTNHSETGNDSKSQKNPWDPNVNPQKIPRALLSEQSCEALWIPAFNNSTKWLSSSKSEVSSEWKNELLKLNPEDFKKQTTGTGNKIYSELSKGIHPEFFVRREVKFDESTLATALENSIKWVTTLALISHFASGIRIDLSREDAFNKFIEVERIINGQQ